MTYHVAFNPLNHMCRLYIRMDDLIIAIFEAKTWAELLPQIPGIIVGFEGIDVRPTKTGG